MYICDFSRSVGEGSATTRNTRGLTRSVIALIVPPLPALSRPSNTTQTFAPEALTHTCIATSSACSLRSSASYSLRFIFVLIPACTMARRRVVRPHPGPGGTRSPAIGRSPAEGDRRELGRAYPASRGHGQWYGSRHGAGVARPGEAAAARGAAALRPARPPDRAPGRGGRGAPDAPGRTGRFREDPAARRLGGRGGAPHGMVRPRRRQLRRHPPLEGRLRGARRSVTRLRRRGAGDAPGAGHCRATAWGRAVCCATSGTPSCGSPATGRTTW